VADTAPIITISDLHRSFGSQRVLEGVSLDIERGRTTVILGPSGCGKSVLLKHIVGLLRPDRGEIRFDGQRIDQLNERELVPVRRRIGFLFQQSALFDSMSVGENVAFPLVEHTRTTHTQRAERVREVLSMVGLADTVAKMPADLSGGQRKRVALARAIVLGPEVVLYDEPTTGLDPIRADVINELIMRLQARLNITSIVVTHDLLSAFKVAHRMVMLYDGRVLLDGLPEMFRTSDDPMVGRFMRGEATDEELADLQVRPHQTGPRGIGTDDAHEDHAS